MFCWEDFSHIWCWVESFLRYLLQMSQLDGKKIQITNHLVSLAQNYFHHRH